MKKNILFSFSILVFILLFIPIPFRGESGLYNTFSGLIYCEPSACVHETGHKLDDLSGWVSKSEDFKEAVVNIGLDFQLEKIGPQETYAAIYSFSEGKKENMPLELQRFYDWNLADKLLRDFN